MEMNTNQICCVENGRVFVLVCDELVWFVSAHSVPI